MPPSSKKSDGALIVRNTLIVLAIVIVALLAWQIRTVFLLTFAGVIFSVILSGFARIFQHYVPVSRPVAIVATVIIVLFIIGSFGLLFGSQILEEFGDLIEKLPEQISDLRETIRELPLGQRFLGTVEQGNTGTDNNGGTERIVFQFGMTVADAVSSLVIVFAIGIYFTINPEMYKKGVALLFTKNYAERVYDAVETAGNALWRWLTGQLIAMLFVGVSVTIGLLLLDVPLALVIGVLSGLADFVPIIGPIAAFVPAFFLALSVDTETAIYTSLLYLAVQQIEGNVVTPLVQKKMVYVPPAVILLSMVAFGAVFGIPGVILATPLTVIAMVFIGMFYVQDVLGKDVTIPGKN
jgi:predicted PurR-regulated permease PerM